MDIEKIVSQCLVYHGLNIEIFFGILSRMYVGIESDEFSGTFGIPEGQISVRNERIDIGFAGSESQGTGQGDMRVSIGDFMAVETIVELSHTFVIFRILIHDDKFGSLEFVYVDIVINGEVFQFHRDFFDDGISLFASENAIDSEHVVNVENRDGTACVFGAIFQQFRVVRESGKVV
jgi:hypothetical protein